MSTYWVSFLVKLAVLAIAASTDLESRIQNGEPLGPEHKHLVQLSVHFYPFKTGEENFLCTGSILNERWIITAKHCLHRDGYQLILAKVIRHMYEYMLTPIKFVDVQILQVDGQHTRAQNDIALCKVATPITLNDGVHQAIALHVNYPSQGLRAVIAGYGNPAPSVPRQGTVILQNCNEGPLCSFSSGSMARPDFGDSGGPLMLNGNLVGIISEGKTLTGNPPTYEEHYVAIAFHYNWIMNVIQT